MRLRSIEIILSVPMVFLWVACAVDPLPPEDPVPGYSIEQPQGVLVGWSRLAELPHPDSLIYRASYQLPGHPFRDYVESEFRREGMDWVYDWSVGREGGPALRARIAREGRGAWAWALAGWGELGLLHDLAPAEEEPVPFNPLSPLGFALLGWRWETAGSPASLDLPLLWFPDPNVAPLLETAQLLYEGVVVESGMDLHSFRLEVAGGPVFFKLMSEHFPTLLNAWWKPPGIALRFWNGVPDISGQFFAPEFPAPEGYTVAQSTVTEGDLVLAVESARPEGTGPFPAALLVADAGPNDRNDAALFGHLADDLARHGWLVYRYDKPGTGSSGGELDSLDLGGRRRALAAVWQEMITDPDVDPERCVLVGHGEGAALALERCAFFGDAAGVVALAPPLYSPADVPVIPEAENAPGDWIELLGLDCFVDKHRDLLDFDSEVFLSLPAWAGRPVALHVGAFDETVPLGEYAEQKLLLEVAGAELATKYWEGMDHFMNGARPDDPPDPALVEEILAWLDENFPPLR